MTIPQLPEKGATDWYDHYKALHLRISNLESNFPVTLVSGDFTLPSAAPIGSIFVYRVDDRAVFFGDHQTQLVLYKGTYVMERVSEYSGWSWRPMSSGRLMQGLTYKDTFNGSGSLFYSPVEVGAGAQWQSALRSPLGTSDITRSSGKAIMNTTSGQGARIDATALDWAVEVDFDFANFSSQVRVFARGKHDYTTVNREEMPVQAVIRDTGAVQFEPFWDGSGWKQKSIGTIKHNSAKTGTLRLEVINAKARVFVNGSQIGDEETLPVYQQIGHSIGFGLYGRSAAITEFRAYQI